MHGEAEVFACEPHTIARYRLELVCESKIPYGAEPHCEDPSQVAEFLRPLVGGYAQEVMGAVFLNIQNFVIGYTVAYIGTISKISVETRGLLVPALLANAARLVAFHTHPSGDLEPSAEDRAFTRSLAEAAQVLGIHLADHVILSEAGEISMARREDWPGSPYHVVVLS